MVSLFVLALCVATAEWALCRHRGLPAATLAETGRSLWLGLGNLLTTILFAELNLAFWYVCYEFRAFDLKVDWLYFVALLVLWDLSFYAYHRVAHSVRWFWAAHVNHHSGVELNLFTGLRNTWTGLIAGDAIFKAALVLIGFAPEHVLLASALQLVISFFQHTQLVGRLPGPIEFIFSTPSHHRVHHARNENCLDKNFGGVFIIWDRLFGTFLDERSAPTLTYGVPEAPAKWGPFSLPFHEWQRMLSDVRRARWRDKLAFLVRPPGWSPQVGKVPAPPPSAVPMPSAVSGRGPAQR